MSLTNIYATGAILEFGFKLSMSIIRAKRFCAWLRKAGLHTSTRWASIFLVSAVSDKVELFDIL
jgi:hypothetical protein